MFKIIVLISGRGSNLNAIIEQTRNQYLNINISAVISNNENANGLKIAENHKIKTFILKEKDKLSRSNTILEIAEEIKDVKLIVCAGYNSILSGELLNKFKNKIINIHPSLVPAFSGKGFYGMKIHEAVFKSGVKITGCTVHVVTADVDGGPIISQKTVPILRSDTPESIAQKVLLVEHKMLIKTIRLFYEDKIEFIENKAFKKDSL